MNWFERTYWIIGIPAALLLAWLLVYGYEPAYGHGDAAWIQENYPLCCGPTDCEPVAAADVARIKAGWVVDGYEGVLPHKDLRRSMDGRWWACEIFLGGDDGDEGDEGDYRGIRCLFRPGSMM